MKVSEMLVGVVIILCAAAALVFAYMAVTTGSGQYASVPAGQNPGTYRSVDYGLDAGAWKSIWKALATGAAGFSGVGGLVFGILHGVHNQPE